MNALYISSFCQRLSLESSLFKRYEAIFNVALKLVIRDCIGLLCDWFRKLVSLFQPIRYKTKDTHHLVALGSLGGSTWGFRWLIKVFYFPLIDGCDYIYYIGYGFRHSIEKRLWHYP